MNGMPLAFSLLVASAVLLGFVGLWRMTAAEDAVEARLRQYGGVANALAGTPLAENKGKGLKGMNRLLAGLDIGRALADRMSRADVPMTVAEFLLIAALIAGGLALVGFWRGGFLMGVVLSAAGVFLPLIYLNVRANKRKEAFINQLPDALTLLVGALKAGFGIGQAMEMLVNRMNKPASVEFGRVIRASSLGVPVNRALNDMADRVGSDDLYLVVTAVNVQMELGGNLAQILEIIAETVRERIRIKREIRVLTAQQRFTGYMLVGLPIVVAIVLSTIQKDYLAPLFQPGIMRIVLIGTILMIALGFWVIRKIIDVEV